MKDSFKFWEPGRGKTENKYLESFSTDYDGLTILLKGSNTNEKALKITFSNYLAFRTANESYRLKSLHENKSYRCSFVNGINISNDSEFLDWFKSETHDIYNESLPIHYLICTNDDITDIISFDEPILE